MFINTSIAYLGVVADESGVDAFHLKEVAHELVQHAGRGLRRGAQHLMLSQLLLQKLDSFLTAK